MNKKVDTHNIQTLTVIGKVARPDDGVALRLGLLGFVATKLWNTALWHTKEQWNSTGKIPGFPEVDRHLKSIACRWYRSLHAQSAQAVLEELNGAYRSWFALRKKGVPDAKPPGFRKKTTLSTVTFKKGSLRWNPETKTLRLGIPKAVFGEPFLYLPVQLPPDREIDPRRIQLVRLFHDKGDWFVHLVCDLPVPEQKSDGHVLAIDLGMNVVAATAGTDGRTMLWSGGELASLERYFEKEKSACTDSQSNKSRRLNRKRSRQRTHLLHSLTRAIVNDAHARGVATLVIGDLTDIRTGKTGEAKNWSDSGNQALHKWPYKRITDMLRYKARLLGISVETISERYTSQDCSQCGTRRKASRVHRGLYACPACGSKIHADINGAVNILQRYLPEASVSWSSGCLAQPAVNRFAWRNTRPFAHEPGTWRSNTPLLPRTQFMPVAA